MGMVGRTLRVAAVPSVPNEDNVMDAITGISLDELKSSAEWQALGSQQMKTLIAQALLNRDLPRTLVATRHVSLAMAQELSIALLKLSAVSDIYVWFSTGIRPSVVPPTGVQTIEMPAPLNPISPTPYRGHDAA